MTNNPLSRFPYPHTTNLIIVAVVVVLGVLLKKEFSAVGIWVSIAGILYYLITDGGRTLNMGRQFRELIPRDKAHVLIYCVLFIIALRGILFMSMSYFTVLVLLAVDYLLTDTGGQQEEAE